jgi:putative DNA primase/helicase
MTSIEVKILIPSSPDQKVGDIVYMNEFNACALLYLSKKDNETPYFEILNPDKLSVKAKKILDGTIQKKMVHKDGRWKSTWVDVSKESKSKQKEELKTHSKKLLEPIKTNINTSSPPPPPVFYNDKNHIKLEILELLADKDKDTKFDSYNNAQEILVKHLISTFYLRTIKQDEKEEIWGYEDGIYVPHGKSLCKEELRDLLGKAYNKNLYTRVIDKIIPSTYVKSEDFFEINHIDYIPVLNGLLNIKTLTLEPFTPHKYFFNKLPIRYNKKAKCPNILKHLSEVLKNPDEDILLFQEFLGFCLLKEMKWEKSVMFLGHGRNGKSLLLSCVSNLFGPVNSSSIDLHILDKNPYAPAYLFQKYVNISGDLPKEALKQSGTFKKMTGGDKISAERKNLTNLDFVNYAKFLFACNHLPQTYDLSDGFFSRWIIFEFPYKFVSKEELEMSSLEERRNLKLRDDSLKEKLNTTDELEGFLIFGLQGLQRLLKNTRFTNTRSERDTKTLWLSRSDSSIGFCSKYIEKDVTVSPYPVEELYAMYVNFCSKNDLDIQTKVSFGQTLTSRFGSVRKQFRVGDQRPWGYTNVKIREKVDVEVIDLK